VETKEENPDVGDVAIAVAMCCCGAVAAATE